MDVDKSVEAKKNLRDIELVCETEMQGSTTLRDLHILVSNASIIFIFNGPPNSREVSLNILTKERSASSSGCLQTPLVTTPAPTY